MISLKLVFRCLKGRLYDNEILLVLVHGCRWTQAASGAAGRANVRLYPASSLISLQPKSRFWTEKFLNAKLFDILNRDRFAVCTLVQRSLFHRRFNYGYIWGFLSRRGDINWSTWNVAWIANYRFDEDGWQLVWNVTKFYFLAPCDLANWSL